MVIIRREKIFLLLSLFFCSFLILAKRETGISQNLRMISGVFMLSLNKLFDKNFLDMALLERRNRIDVCVRSVGQRFFFFKNGIVVIIPIVDIIKVNIFFLFFCSF